MIVDKKVVNDIAALALLEITPEASEEYITSMSQILDLVEEMQSVDTHGVIPMSNPLDGTQVLRSDCVTEKDQHVHFQENAPLTSEGFYLVPRVIE